jgi:hypothetical protein
VTLPISPPWVTTLSPRRSASTIALCSFIFFCCGRISRKYMMAKIRTKGSRAPMKAAGIAAGGLGKAGVANMGIPRLGFVGRAAAPPPGLAAR